MYFINLDISKHWLINIFDIDDNIIIFCSFTMIYIIIVMCILLTDKYRMCVKLSEYNFKIRNLLEPLNNTIKLQRKRTHEFGNQLTILSGYLKSNNIEKASDYLEKIIKFKAKQSENEVVNNIADMGFRQLLTIKELKMEINDIVFYMEIDDTVSNMKIEDGDVFFVLGVLLDNSIEESIMHSKSYVKITAKTKEADIEFYVENQIKDNIQYKKAYSTKGYGRGVGLLLVSDVIKSREDFELNTYKQDNKFIQQLTVKRNIGVKNKKI